MPIVTTSKTLVAVGDTVAVRKMEDNQLKAAYFDRKTNAFRFMFPVVEGSYVDADLEIIRRFIQREYDKHQKAKNERAANCGIQAEELDKLQERYKNYPDQYAALIDILTQRKRKELRGDFWCSIGEQVYAWVISPNPRYNHPLSPSQWEIIIRQYRFKVAKVKPASAASSSRRL